MATQLHHWAGCVIAVDETISYMTTPLHKFAEDVRGRTAPFCGHLLPEEQPEAFARELRDFFG